jgi:hypothetical protein
MTEMEFVAAAEHAISTGDEKSVRQVVDEAGRARAREKELEEALWGFDYNPLNEKRGYFCAGCDLDGDDRATAPDSRHDPECRKARAALKSDRKGE